MLKKVNTDMNINSAIKKLEFDKILFAISQYTLCETTADTINNLVPITDIDKIKFLHSLTNELRLFFDNKGKITFNKIYDFEEQLTVIKKKQFIEAIELYKIAFSVTAYATLKKLFNKENYSSLNSIFKDVSLDESNIRLYKDILANIDESGVINDNASPELSRIRKILFSMDDKINNEIKNFYKTMEKNNYLSDSIITTRNGFPCVLINPSFKRKIDGVVIDSSASKQTLFVTSNKMISLHNELIALHNDEQKEIIKILTNYTKTLKEDLKILQLINQQLLFFDEIYAKTLYALHNDLYSPEIVDNQVINLIEGKHPLINNAIPLTLKLGEEYSTLIITGPNTGGKTVALKTIGLFSLMVQSGVPIPASSSSQFGIFDKLFVSIGDDQSIENALSTFSAQILDLIDITQNANENSLVLLDELGTGTDPIEGSALAISITLFLREKKSLSLITTHYEELKYLASHEDKIKNASMKFDLKNLSPLYKIELGIPGKSFAFEIASQLGLSKKIIETAKSYINDDYLKISSMLNELHNKQDALEKRERELNNLKIKLKEQEKKHNAKGEELKKREREIDKIMRSKESEFLYQARREFERVIKEIRENQASKESIKLGKTFLEDIKDKIENSIEDKQQKKSNMQNFTVGDKVKILSQNHNGTIVSSANSDDEFLVQVGSLTMYIPADDLERVLRDSKSTVKTETKIIIEKTKSKNSLDLRGVRYEEAIFLIEKFIDESIANNNREIKIIHGIGTGAIRECVQQTLNKSPFIQSYDFERNNKQGINFGVTIARLK